MSDRPILFSGLMVQALLDGFKVQTRRLATSPFAKCKPGDRLWVRENFSLEYCVTGSKPKDVAPWESDVWYWADGDPEDGDWTKPKPSIHMPRRLSRLTLEVTGVRHGKLQDTSETGALAEGYPTCIGHHVAMEGQLVGWFRGVWDSLHNKPGQTWDDNPEVVVITFRVIRANVDSAWATPMVGAAQ